LLDTLDEVNIKRIKQIIPIMLSDARAKRSFFAIEH
jgi:hypothetical protein